MQGRLYIFWLFYNCGCRDNEIFSFRANFGCSHPRVWRKLTRFPHGRRKTELQEVVLTFVTLTLLADLDNNVINTYTLHDSFFHAFKNNADTSVPCSLFSWDDPPFRVHFCCFPWTLVLVYILLFPILSVVIAVLGSCITWIHVREHKRTWGRFHPLRDI